MFEPINSCDGIYRDSLDVRFTKSCDNKCAFCIERKGIDNQGQNVEKMIEGTKKSGKKNVLVLGGEPMLNLQTLKTYIDGIKDFVENIYITTSLPNSINQDWNTFTYIMENITCLNVSLQHYDWKINNQVLNASSNHNRIEILEKICVNYSKKVRVSINLVQGYIDTKAKLDTFLKTMEDIGVSHVKINELQHEPDLYVSFRDLYGMILPAPYVYGCQGDIDLGYKMRITLKRSCFCTQPQHIRCTDIEEEKFKQHKNEHTCTVLYEDGTLSDGWIIKKKE